MSIQAITCDHHPHFAAYDFKGNACVSEAEVVLIADVPTNAVIQEQNAVLVNRIWEKHLILVEHLDAGEIAPAGFERHLGKINVVASVTGWDLPGLKDIGARLGARVAVFDAWFVFVEDILKIEQWGPFLDNRGRFRSILPYLSSKLRETTLEHLNLLHEGLFEAFKEGIRTLIKAIKAEHRYQFKKLYEDTFEARTASLQKCIDEALNSQRKVIVFLSSNFLFLNPRLDSDKCQIDDLRAYLSTKKYVVVNHHASPFKIEAAQLLGHGPTRRGLLPDLSVAQFRAEQKEIMPKGLSLAPIAETFEVSSLSSIIEND